MGSLNSVLNDALEITDQSAESREEVTNTNTTPCAPSHRRLYNLDPRSPSEGISRTPIILEKDKSKNVSPSTEKLSSLIDPRSPTNQFLRTPIQPSLQGSSSVARAHEAIEEKIETYQSSESGIDSREASPDPVLTHLRTALFSESPDSAVSSNGSCISSSSLPALASASALTPVRKPPSVQAKQKQSLENLDVGVEGKKVMDTQEVCSLKTSIMRQRILVDKRIGVLSEKDVMPRSPLATLNNSPRPSFDKSNTNRPKAHILADKENDI